MRGWVDELVLSDVVDEPLFVVNGAHEVVLGHVLDESLRVRKDIRFPRWA